MSFEEADIIRFLKGELKGQEKTDFLKSLRRDTTLRETYFRLKDVWDFSGMKLQSIPYDENQEWKKIGNKLHFDNRQLRIGSWWRVAGVAAAILVAFFIGQQQFINTGTDIETMSYHTFEAPQGQLSQLTLADGSQVTLNAGSKLLVPLGFGEQDRTLELQGEGFFDVTKNPNKAFVVKSGDQEVKVLGTRFNIRAYPDEALFETTLEEGAVEWSSHQQQVILTPGTQVVYNPSSHELVQRVVDIAEIKSWSLGRYEYQNAPFSKLASVLEKWHGVKVVYKESDFTGKHFNGTIKKAASLAQTMQIISLMTPLKYSIENDTIRIETIK